MPPAGAARSSSVRWGRWALFVAVIVMGILLSTLGVEDEDGDGAGWRWPDIPQEYEAIPVHLEGTLREVLYIANTLKTLVPVPLPTDDMGFYSDCLRSLETRADLTPRVMEDSNIKMVVHLVTSALIADDNDTDTDTDTATGFEVVARANALRGYWHAVSDKKYKEGREAMQRDGCDLPAVHWQGIVDFDVPIPPFKSADKDAGADADSVDDEWKFVLDEERAREADGIFRSFKADKHRVLSYYKLHGHPRPKPMAWSPLNDAAWDVARAKLEAGELYGFANWKPMYPRWDPLGVPFTWMDPDAEVESDEERLETDRKRDEKREKDEGRRGKQEKLAEELRKKGKA